MKNKLRELRKQRNLTQEELAGFLKVSRQTIIAIENNKYDPSLSLALKMARFFSVPVEDLYPDRI